MWYKRTFFKNTLFISFFIYDRKLIFVLQFFQIKSDGGFYFRFRLNIIFNDKIKCCFHVWNMFAKIVCQSRQSVVLNALSLNSIFTLHVIILFIEHLERQVCLCFIRKIKVAMSYGLTTHHILPCFIVLTFPRFIYLKWRVSLWQHAFDFLNLLSFIDSGNLKHHE